MNILQEMLLIEEPSIFRLYQEMTSIATYFIAPVFTIALLLEYFGEMDFGGVIKKLLLITVFMGAFYQFHTTATKLALDNATYTLKKVSPRNLFVKKWYHVKVRTTEKRDWNFIQSIIVPNLNDILGTAFFLLAKVFIWLLKLIYSTVYHLTYVFSGVTAILYFLGWTKDALKGTVQASLWCMIMPFVIVAILALVGNSIDESALGSELIVTKVDTIIWLFGVTLLLLISPVISYGMIKGDGIHSFGSKMGSMVVDSGLKAMTLYPMLKSGIKRAGRGAGEIGANTLMEPSIRDLLKIENAASKSKMNLLDKKGSFKSPFKQGRTLDERLQEAGMTKEEAMVLSRNPSVKSQKMTDTVQSSTSSSSNRPTHQFVKQEKDSFKFDQKYWDSITPEHRQGIKKKYGLGGEKMSSGRIHFSVNSGRASVAAPVKENLRKESKRTPFKLQLNRPRKKERSRELR